MDLDAATQEKLEAAAFRRLVEHLRKRTDVQNIDMMNLAGFCRNCLSNWMAEEAGKAGVALGKDEARELVYGMPYEDWKRAPPARGDGGTEGCLRRQPSGALIRLQTLGLPIKPPLDPAFGPWQGRRNSQLKEC